MNWLQRFLYLFFADSQWARKILGGKWVRRTQVGCPWVTWNGILEKHCGWPLTGDEYQSEEWPEKPGSSWWKTAAEIAKEAEL